MGVMSVRELNANISKALALVEAGETLDITKFGKVIAELRPKTIIKDAAWHDAAAKLITSMREGLPIGAGKVTEHHKYGDQPI